jgi:hypothetical protein
VRGPLAVLAAGAFAGSALTGAAGLFAIVAVPGEAQAQCSVLRRQPCLPYNYPRYYPCGLNVRPGCVPSILLPLNQVPVIKVQGHTGESEPIDRDNKVNRLDQIGALLSKCLEMPPDDEVRPGMRVTMKLAFKRDGELLAPPRFTYTTHEATQDDKVHYHQAALDMLKRCAPLPITDALGGAIAGRPLVIPIIETRTERQPDSSPTTGAEPPSLKPDNARPEERKDQ